MGYTREDACRVWLSCATLSRACVAVLLARYGSAEGVYDTVARHGIHALQETVALTEWQEQTLDTERERTRMHGKLTVMRDMRIRLLQEEDGLFPEMLRQVSDPPWLMFYRGDLNCLMGRHLAIVGTRKCSAYGREAARAIGAELSASGVSIVSGMAAGIDTAALEGCMEGASPAIGISGGGLDHPAPMGRERLDEDILRSGGLLLSEYPPGAVVKKFNFPKRNRLISALSDGVLFMEGRIRSGGMITVGHALDQGKDVFAFPGQVGLDGSEGPLQLIREGATLFRNASDVLEDKRWQEIVPASAKTMQEIPELPTEQQTILSLLTVEEQSFDELTLKTGMDASRLNTALTLLELTGLIRQGSGRIYHKA